jgi:hypothetical protein
MMTAALKIKEFGTPPAIPERIAIAIAIAGT